MYWRSSGPNRSSANRRCPTTGKLRRIVCFFCVTSCAATAPTTAAAPAATRFHLMVALSSAPDDWVSIPRAANGGLPFTAWIWCPKPDQVVSAASNVAHKVLYGGLADLRPMPRTLIDEGDAPRGLPLPARRHRARAGRPGAAGDAARRAGALLRPAPRLLAGRALRRGRPADVPRRVRRGVVQEPRPRHRALGRRGRAHRRRGGLEARRRTAGAPGRLEPGRDLQPARGRGPPRPADRLGHRGRVPGRRHARCRWSRRCGRC